MAPDAEEGVCERERDDAPHPGCGLVVAVDAVGSVYFTLSIHDIATAQTILGEFGIPTYVAGGQLSHAMPAI